MRVDSRTSGFHQERKKKANSRRIRNVVTAITAVSLKNTDSRLFWRGPWCASFPDFVIESAQEEVARAAHGLEVARRLRVVAQLLAQAAHENIKRAVDGIPFSPLEQVDQAFAVQYHAREAREHSERVEFQRGEPEVFSVAHGGTLAHVHLKVAAPQDFAAHGSLFAPQHGLNARGQFARFEGLGQIVVGADLQPHDAVGDFTTCRQHDDGHVGRFADFPADFETVLAGKHHVQQDAVGWVDAQHAQAVVAVRTVGQNDLETTQVFGEQAGKFPVIVDKQGFDLHGGTLRWLWEPTVNC